MANVAPQRLTNTEEQIQELNNLIIPEDFSMVSFDVKNLFMPIPHELAGACVREANAGNDEHWTDVESVMKITNLSMVANVFSI